LHEFICGAPVDYHDVRFQRIALRLLACSAFSFGLFSFPLAASGPSFRGSGSSQPLLQHRLQSAHWQGPFPASFLQLTDRHRLDLMLILKLSLLPFNFCATYGTTACAITEITDAIALPKPEQQLYLVVRGAISAAFVVRGAISAVFVAIGQ
jgi:hypothetical protein